MPSLSEDARDGGEEKIAEPQDRGEKPLAPNGDQSPAGPSEPSSLTGSGGSTSAKSELHEQQSSTKSKTDSQGQPVHSNIHGEPFSFGQHPSNLPPFGNMWYPWTLDPAAIRFNPQFSAERPDQAQATMLSSMVPILCPAPFPGNLMAPMSEEQRLRNGGIFAVPVVPVIAPFPPGGLIPIPQNIPQGTLLPGNVVSQGPTAVSRVSDRAVPVQPHDGQGQHQHAPVPPRVGLVQRPDGQRQVVRRFHVAFQIDLLLILKLAVVVFVFNQDGSRDRLILLLFLAGLVYLYQTGALTPLLQWISRSAHRAMAPPQQLAHAPPAADMPAGGGNALDGNAANAPGPGPGPGPAAEAAAPPAGQGQAAAQVVGGPNAEAAGDQGQQPPPPVPQVPTWWGFLKELQMLVVGFVTSLLPGFHQHVD